MKKNIKNHILLVSGTVLVAFAVSVFYTPNKIVTGGASGLSTILFHTLGISPGVSIAVISIILSLIAFFLLGRRFVLDSLIGSLLLSFFVWIFSYIPKFCDDLALASVCGAVLYGIGIGLAYSAEASTGGMDILCRIIQHFFPQIKIGNISLAVDAVILASSFIIFGNPNLTLYCIIALRVSSLFINWVIHKLNISKLVFVVTSNGYETASKLTCSSPRGVTIIDAVGGYTANKNTVLMCAMKENEVEMFQKRVLEIDENAFIIFSEATQILGNGFHLYK